MAAIKVSLRVEGMGMLESDGKRGAGDCNGHLHGLRGRAGFTGDGDAEVSVISTAREKANPGKVAGGYESLMGEEAGC